jgi:hypothetical protein
MRLRDLPAWKPIWYGDDLSVYVEGEVGILADATNVEGRALSLMITYQGREYNGWLAADPPIIEEIFPLIKKLAGRPVAEVAAIEIHTSSAEAAEASSEPQRKPDERQPPEPNRNEVSSPLKQYMNDTEGRELRLQSLLASIQLAGTANYEREIGEIQTMQSLTEKEREVIREIFIAGFEQARREGRDDKAWAYERLARRLILRQPLNDVTFPSDAGLRECRSSGRHGSARCQCSNSSHPPTKQRCPEVGAEPVQQVHNRERRVLFDARCVFFSWAQPLSTRKLEWATGDSTSAARIH